MQNRDTIAAVSTPIGEGGIGIVRISGDRALSIADKIFVGKKGKPSKFPSHTVRYGHIRRRSVDNNNEIIDEVLLTVMRKPGTYTKEDIVEINCHGGVMPLKMVFEEVIRGGARPAEPGEFTKRAFLNGRIDLAQAEAVCDVIKSNTEASLKVAVSHLEGDFSGEIRSDRENLLDVLKDLEARIDFSEEDIEPSVNAQDITRLKEVFIRLENVLKTESKGMLLKEGITCVICGKPNVGKSSLLNTLLKRNRAIVTHLPGTTRDTIEEIINLQGIAVKIVDTAGIVKARNIVEKEGVQRSRNYIRKADIAILMVDLSRAFDKKDKEILKILPPGKTIVVANKSDLKHMFDPGHIRQLKDKKTIMASVLKKTNIKLIEEGISETIWGGKVIHPEPTFLTSVRHKKALRSAVKSLRAGIRTLEKESSSELAVVDIREAIFQLGLITGESVDLNILDRIFDKFCIGK